MSTIDEILDGVEETGEQVETTTEEVTAEADAPKEEAAETETETIEVEEKPETEASPAPESIVPVSALHGERDRRKAAEAKLKELEAQIADKDKPAPTSVFDDEGKFRQELESAVDAKLRNTVLGLTEVFARRIHGDETVDKAIDWFSETAASSPVLLQEFQQSQDVDVVVGLYKKHLEAEELKDVPGQKAKLEAQVREEIEAKIRKEYEDKAALQNSVPTSLVGESSAGGLTSQDSDWTPPAAEDLYG